VNNLHFSDKELLRTELIVRMYGNCNRGFMNISVGSVVWLPLYWYVMVFFLLRSMYLERCCKSYEFGSMLWKLSWCNRRNMDGYWRGTEKHHKKAEFHILYPPPRIKPNLYRVQSECLITTRTVGKEFLKYFSVEDQGEDDFLRLRNKYYEIYFVWMICINGNRWS
jgi:hypothetical protein